MIRATAKRFGRGKQLHMNLKPNHGLVFGKNFSRKRGCGHR